MLLHDKTSEEVHLLSGVVYCKLHVGFANVLFGFYPTHETILSVGSRFPSIFSNSTEGSISGGRE